MSFLSFQYSHPVHVFLPFVSSRSCGYILPIISIPIKSFRFDYIFYCNLPISFNMSFFKFQYSPTLVTSFLSFQFLPSVCCQAHHFVTSVLMFFLIYKVPSLLLPLRFSSYTSYSLFVILILSLQFFPFIRYISLSL